MPEEALRSRIGVVPQKAVLFKGTIRSNLPWGKPDAKEEELWQAQRDAIRELANKESCVIVGRNGDYILREFDHCLNVFVHAGFDWRVKRMTKMMDQVPADQVANDVRAVDKARKRYCEYYTKRAYGDAGNFDLTVNTEKLGIEKAVEMILAAAAD